MQTHIFCITPRLKNSHRENVSKSQNLKEIWRQIWDLKIDNVKKKIWKSFQISKYHTNDFLIWRNAQNNFPWNCDNKYFCHGKKNVFSIIIFFVFRFSKCSRFFNIFKNVEIFLMIFPPKNFEIFQLKTKQIVIIFLQLKNIHTTHTYNPSYYQSSKQH